MLRTLRAELQHDAHGRVRVDVRVVALQIRVDGVREEDVAVARHEVLLREAALRVALAVRDVAARDVVMAVREQLLLDEILYLLDADLRARPERLLNARRHRVDLERRHRMDVLLACRRDGVPNLRTIIGHGMPRTLRHRCHCHVLNSFVKHYILCLAYRCSRTYCIRGWGNWQEIFEELRHS